MGPFFSIIITAFNREKLITRALKSLINQDFTDWEAVIVDDGSSDNTFEVIKPIVLSYSNIKYIFQKNQGLPTARNTGVYQSRGQYITFLDSDDEYKINHLTTRYLILQENPQIDLLHGGFEIFGDPFVPDKNNPSKLIHLDNCIIGGTFFIKRDVFQKIGYFRNVDYADDTDFFERVENCGLKIMKTEIKTYIYHRETPNSMCNFLKSQLK
ncbi:MAG: glycosyltransferase family 2 protein [Candidatus Kapabacteria bacterium]|nr:glycosyltransferase family 2 protein [Candidatus Kapabacteria bacterium]